MMPRRPIVVAEVMSIIHVHCFVKFVQVPLITVCHSQEIHHSAETSQVKPKDLREGNKDDLVSNTEYPEPSYLSNDPYNNQSHDRCEELP